LHPFKIYSQSATRRACRAFSSLDLESPTLTALKLIRLRARERGAKGRLKLCSTRSVTFLFFSFQCFSCAHSKRFTRYNPI
jgi:hypothetical protein